MQRLLISAATALALASAPAAHAAQPARAAEPIESASEMGGSLPLSVIIVLLTVIGGALYLLIDGDDAPDSP